MDKPDIQLRGQIGVWEDDRVEINGCERKNIPADVLAWWEEFSSPYPKDDFTPPTTAYDQYDSCLAHMVKMPKWGYFEESWCAITYKRQLEWADKPAEFVNAITVMEIRRTTPEEEKAIWLCGREKAGK